MNPPRDIRPVGESEILVTWDDGHRSLYACRDLRLLCPCAGCVDETTGRRMTRPEEIPQVIKPLETSAVGRYGVRFKWNDGHGTGIYSFDYLRKVCPCTVCSGETKRIESGRAR